MSFSKIEHLISTIQKNLEQAADNPVKSLMISFLHEPSLAMELIQYIDQLREGDLDEDDAPFVACMFAFELGLNELQMSLENGNRQAHKVLHQTMTQLAQIMQKSGHSLGFWMPVLSIFYDLHITLIPALQEVYCDLAEEDFAREPFDATSSQNHLRGILDEYEGLSDFDIAEHFFAQSYAMPPDFVEQLTYDLFDIDTGREVALLTLLHPDLSCRQSALDAWERLLSREVLSPQSLTRLDLIKNWYPDVWQQKLKHWIMQQRKQGVVYATARKKSKILHIKASEVDGTGAQGIYILLRTPQKEIILAGLLLKEGVGIKDVWLSRSSQQENLEAFYHSASDDDNVSIRNVTIDYFEQMASHFLAVMLENDSFPPLHFFELIEYLGLVIRPQYMDVPRIIAEGMVHITPFNDETVQDALKRTKKWIHTKRFTESWYAENAYVDKLVNAHCSIEEGTKTCNLAAAMTAVFEGVFEPERAFWILHFLKMSLWARAKPHKNEKLGFDSLVIAYLLQEQSPFSEIPLMVAICHQTVINSLETMQTRKTYLA